MPQGRTSSTTSCLGMPCTFSRWRRMFVTCWGNISRDSSLFPSVFLSPHMFTLYGWYVPAQPSWWHHRSPASLACTNKYCCISRGVICRNETTVQDSDKTIQMVEITGVCPLSLHQLYPNTHTPCLLACPPHTCIHVHTTLVAKPQEI